MRRAKHGGSEVYGTGQGFLMRSKKLTEIRSLQTHSAAEHRFPEAEARNNRGHNVRGELTPRVRTYRGQHKKSEPGTGTWLRNHRRFLFGRAIVFLCISFSFLLGSLPFETLQFSSHLIPFTLTRASRRLNCLCRRHRNGNLPRLPWKMTSRGLTWRVVSPNRRGMKRVGHSR